MAEKAIVRVGQDAARAQGIVEQQGGAVLANYGQALLVQVDEAGLRSLQDAGFQARVQPETTAFDIGGFQINTDRPEVRASSAVALDMALPSGRSHQVLQVAGPMHPQWKAELDRLGVAILESLAENVYLVEVDAGNVDDLQALDFVEGVYPYYPALKVNPVLLTSQLQANLAIGDALVPIAGGEGGGEGRPEGPINTTRSEPPLEAAGDLELVLFDASALLPVADAARRLGAEVISAEGNTIVVAGAGLVQELAALPQVREVNPYSPPRLHNNVATGIIQANVLQGVHSLDGAGQIVGIADTGLDTGVNDASMLDDFEGRIVALFALGRPGDASDPDGHGTHVAGSVLGDGSNSSGNVRGIAPAASVVFQSILDAGGGLGGIPFNLGLGLFDTARDNGARIHTNSWGADVNGAYNIRSTQADTFGFNNREFLIVFSAGNDAPNRIGSPGTAKNVLTVGASESMRALANGVNFPASPSFPTGATANFTAQADNQNQVAAFSSVGPAQNMRRKPDVVAPGTWILSTRSSVAVYDAGPDGLGPNEVPPSGTGDEDGVATHPEAVGLGLPGQPIFAAGSANTPALPAGSGAGAEQDYMYLSGTSMATPITAGAVALLRQFLIEQRGHTPSAALLKAIIVNGAVDMGMGIPHNGQGWGRIELSNMLFPPGTNRVQFDDTLDNAVASTDIRMYDVHVASAAAPLVTTLVWRDPAGATIQNRLHLRVIHVPTGDTFTADNIADIRNNVQKVTLGAPAPGQYRIEVEGVNVGTGVPELAGLRQDYALVVAGGNGFSCNPSDIVQVIDRSGSMGFFGYMEPAKARAAQMVDILQINDRIGLVTFSSAAAPGDPLSLTPINSQDDKDNANALITPVTAGGETDLREALEDGLATLGADAGRPRAMVFLSDGHHTVPTPPIDNAFLDGIAAANVRVYTISLGPASDMATLDNIANRTGTGSTYTVASAADLHRLHEIYYDILGGIGCGSVVHLASSAIEPGAEHVETVIVDETAREAHFASSWDAASVEMELLLESPGGQVFDRNSAEVFHMQRPRHQFYRVPRPEGGEWRMILRSRGHNQPITVTTAALAESEARCEITVHPEFLFHGQLLLSLKAQFRGKPLVDGRASAAITFPTQPVDALLDAHADELAEIKVDPETLQGDRDDEALLRLGVLVAQYGAAGKDLFEQKVLELELRDDGREEDPAAGDGIYTAFFDPQQAGAAGPFEVKVVFEGKAYGLGLHRCTKLVPVFVPRKRLPTLRIIGPYYRRNSRWGYTILIARVLKLTGKVATPADGVRVTMTVTQGDQSAESGDLPYDKRGSYYIWRFPGIGFLRGKAQVAVQAWVGAEPAASNSGMVMLS